MDYFYACFSQQYQIRTENLLYRTWYTNSLFHLRTYGTYFTKFVSYDRFVHAYVNRSFFSIFTKTRLRYGTGRKTSTHRIKQRHTYFEQFRVSCADLTHRPHAVEFFHGKDSWTSQDHNHILTCKYN